MEEESKGWIFSPLQHTDSFMDTSVTGSFHISAMCHTGTGKLSLACFRK